MIFQAPEQAQKIPEWVHTLAEWIGIALILWGFRTSAKKDTEIRHEENKKANKQIIDNQAQVLLDLQVERDYLPQHWHGEFDQIRFGGPARPLSTDGIIRRPGNGKSDK